MVHSDKEEDPRREEFKAVTAGLLNRWERATERERASETQRDEEKCINMSINMETHFSACYPSICVRADS